MIAGDMITAVMGDSPEYAFIPLIMLSANTNGYHRLKAFAWGAALLLAPLNYFFADSFKELWSSWYENNNSAEEDNNSIAVIPLKQSNTEEL